MTQLKPWELHVAETEWRRILDHFFPGDRREHGGVLICGVSREQVRNRLLVRTFVPACEPADYGTGDRGTNQLRPDFIRDQILACRDDQLAYLAVHNHGGSTNVAFSAIDLASHEHGYPALRDINKPNPVGGLVLAESAVAGDLWLPDGDRVNLTRTVIVGSRRTELTAAPVNHDLKTANQYHRQTLMFGDLGQARLASARVAIVGLGGIGSLASQLLARVGIGHLILIDPDYVEETNISRLVDATRRDAGQLPEWLPVPNALRPHLRRRLKRPKTALAKRVARKANPNIEITELQRDVATDEAAAVLRSADFILLAADTMSARLVINAIAYQYLIPVIQTGSKVQTQNGQIVRISSAVRPIGTQGGCLWCNGLISPTELAAEGLDQENRAAQRYVDDEEVAAPSVVTLNSVAAGIAANHAMQYLTGLGATDDGWLHVEPTSGTATWLEPRRDPTCTECGDDGPSRRCRGDSARLPTLQA